MGQQTKQNTGVYLYLSSLLIFIACFAVGLAIAARKPLWGDEIVSLNYVANSSYVSLLTQRILEGNICHLFYLLQKVFCDLAGFSLPAPWAAGDWQYVDPRSWMIVRLNPIFFMSLAITLIFYYFSRFYSKIAGWYSLFIVLSSYMVWGYWAEARPYALWIFLITAQSFLFLRLVEAKRFSKSTGTLLVIVHLLLAFTSILSVVLVVSVSCLLWIYVDKDWRRYILLTALPSLISFIYYLYSPKWQWWFANTPLELINASIPKDRFLIIFLFVGFLLLSLGQKRTDRLRFFNSDVIKKGIPYLILTGLTVLSAFAVIFSFQLIANTDHQGFQVPGRYFIYLTPVGIIAVTLFSIQLWRACPPGQPTGRRALRGKIWLQILLAGGLGCLILFRAVRTYVLVKGFYFFH